MKFYTFKRESDQFDDIIKDIGIKSYISTKIKWKKYLMIGLNHSADEKIYGYIVLKYGEDIVNLAERDFTPIPHKDYIPKRN